VGRDRRSDVNPEARERRNGSGGSGARMGGGDRSGSQGSGASRGSRGSHGSGGSGARMGCGDRSGSYGRRPPQGQGMQGLGYGNGGGGYRGGRGGGGRGGNGRDGRMRAPEWGDREMQMMPRMYPGDNMGRGMDRDRGDRGMDRGMDYGYGPPMQMGGMPYQEGDRHFGGGGFNGHGQGGPGMDRGDMGMDRGMDRGMEMGNGRGANKGPSGFGMSPVLSFKAFAHNQREDLSGDLQSLYSRYRLDYCHEFSGAFFRASVGLEWFQDRYNPVHLHAVDAATAQRAVAVSAAFRETVLAAPVQAVAGMCLDPLSSPEKHAQDKQDKRRRHPRSQSGEASAGAEEAEGADGAGGVEGAEAEAGADVEAGAEAATPADAESAVVETIETGV
jgi:hypothetical protein